MPGRYKSTSSKKNWKKKYIPKSIRRLQNIRKVVKSVQKHRDTYLTGIYTLAHTVGHFLKK